ncbi:DUF2339 domain-containing protein [Hufsiella ginkgonis]|uniref:DUF2339 domain-containing protein n=1 Tax=Hufsiella ginkgonis TaxID=2695274 RepID=A0A7K1XYQ2_9SPHI|nr:DUF2339 domain-containing protein [Hufsiella ginkgonis]MXV15686.1 DUF2339 domain-containing protein [Hufsiella ginkgonis]
MEILTIVLLVLIIVILLNGNFKTGDRIGQLESRINALHQLLKQFQELPKPERHKPATVTHPAPAEKPAVEKPPVIVREPEVVAFKEMIEPPAPVKAVPERVPVRVSAPEPKLSFFEKHPDLEKFIGENLVNKIGIAILVLAIGYFVKYAIDKDWVSEAGRVATGIACGGILIGIAHRMRNSYKAFSSVLVGGGLAVFYFTITLAFHEFHLFTQVTTFVILIGITAFAVALALLYDKQEIAVIALLGGLASPFMVSTGKADYNALCVYLVLLNTGLLVISIYKSWRILNASAFALTVIVFAGVVCSLEISTYKTGFIYAGVLYLLYTVINIAHAVKEGKKFIASDFSILLINTGLYFSAGLYLLNRMEATAFRGMFTASLGAVNLVLTWLLFRSPKTDRNILFLFIGITLSFISLTAPIQLSGHYITLFWATETVLLYWLFQKLSIKLLGTSALLVWLAMVVSLVMDWLNVYGTAGAPVAVIANKGFITSLFAGSCTAVLARLAKNGESDRLHFFKMNLPVLRIATVLVFFIGGAAEVNHQFTSHFPGTGLNLIYLMLYLPLFVCGLQLVIRMLKMEVDQMIIFFVLAGCILVYFAFIPSFFDAQYETLEHHGYPYAHFNAHWAAAIFLGIVIRDMARMLKLFNPNARNTFTWLLSMAVVAFLSVEINMAANSLFYSGAGSLARIGDVYTRTGLPILWGLLSFALMWMGMRAKARNLRIISLTLFTITLVKLFTYDIIHIPAAGKIAAFFCLGILLLIISFMYQKVKKIIAEDEPLKID